MMSERIHAQINPAALLWAREVRGMPLDVAAKKIGVSADRLAAFEYGSGQPTIGQLRTIGRVFRKPTAFFYLRKLPPLPSRLRDFRRVPDAGAPLSPELLDAITRARQRRADAIELGRLLGQPLPAFSMRGSLDQPEALGATLREHVGIDLRAQFTWRKPYTALRSWTAAVEAAGVLVSQFGDVEVEEARGFSLADRPLPLVALNGKDSPRAKVFTLFHELAHVVVGATGVCDLHEGQADVQSRVETFCNRVAAAALMPEQAVIEQDVVARHQGTQWSDDQLHELATRFSVSQEAILRRLLTLGRTTAAFYQRKRSEYLERLEGSTEGGFMPYFRRVVRDNGVAFTSLALSAYDHRTISGLELSRLLGGIKLRHVPNIADAIRRAR